MAELFTNPVITDNDGKDHGDPFVMKYLDTYYLYHTGRTGISLYTSPDLVHWTYEGVALQASTAPDHWAQMDLWAPEVMLQDGVFYMYVAATRWEAEGKADDQARRQGIARADNPRGPFVWDPQPLVKAWSIDGHPFRDEDGQLWLFYNIRTDATRYWDGTTGCGNVVDRMLAPDQLEGEQAKVAFPDHRWEGTREGTWYWNEGPAVLKRRSMYYQMYSGGFYADETYGVGFATAPAPRGPWTKYPGNPILRTGRGIKGPGHHCVVKGPDGVTPYVVYHGYLPGQKGRKDHVDRLFWAGDRLVIAGPTAGEQPVPPGPVFDPAVPHWHVGAWVSGTRATAAGVTVELPEAGCHHLEAVAAGGTLRVWLDGVLRHKGALGEGQPAITADGAVRGSSRTSWLDDEALYPLPDGACQIWQWGGSGPVEVSLAVQGRAVVTAGAQQLAVETAGDRYTRVQFTVPGGAERLEVRALSGSATVTDVTLTAR